ncbi:hypothetical protein NQZ68_027511 [Dissostichus eleginoides]|nr:hypothetical protein NQZ68_027511 [Dissostichus eleginoides]
MAGPSTRAKLNSIDRLSGAGMAASFCLSTGTRKTGCWLTCRYVAAAAATAAAASHTQVLLLIFREVWNQRRETHTQLLSAGVRHRSAATGHRLSRAPGPELCSESDEATFSPQITLEQVDI